MMRGTGLDEIIVLDPSLRDRHSHHHVINLNLARCAQARSARLRVFGHRRTVIADTTFGYTVVPHFRRSIYEDTPLLSNASYAEQVLAHRDDVIGLWQHVAAEVPSRLIIHTTTAAFLQGLADAWAHRPGAIRAMAVQLMFRPESMATTGADVAHGWARYRLALRVLRERADVTGSCLSISTSCREFARAFTAAVALPGSPSVGKRIQRGSDVELHPHAVFSRLPFGEAEATELAAGLHRPTLPAAQDDACNLGHLEGRIERVLLFAGDPKLDKGLAWIVEALVSLLAVDTEREYWLHLGPNRFAKPEIDALFQRIQRLKDRHERLHVVWGYMEADRWKRMLAHMDKVLLPYDPATYRHKTSGVLGDCIRHLRPQARLLLSAGSWLAREAAAWGIGHATCDYEDTVLLSQLLTGKGTAGKALSWPSMGDVRTLSPDIWQRAFGRGNDEFLLDAVMGDPST
jgi:hypothetical protein